MIVRIAPNTNVRHLRDQLATVGLEIGLKDGAYELRSKPLRPISIRTWHKGPIGQQENTNAEL